VQISDKNQWRFCTLLIKTMTNRKFYIAFAILSSLVIITLVAFGFIVSTPLLQKIASQQSEQQKITLEKPLLNPLNPKIGPDNARLKIVEFGDFLCPISKQTAPELMKLAEDYPDDVQIVWKDFPNITLHPQAVIISIAAKCADEQNMFWEYHDLAFASQSILSGVDAGPILLDMADTIGLDRFSFTRCLTESKTLEIVKNNFEEGRALGITGTPYLFINEVIKIDGAITYEELVEYLQ